MADVTLTPSVTLNGQTVNVTVYEDLNYTGSTDNEETVTDVEDGAEYTLSNLEGGEGNAYWVDIDLSTSDVEESPVVHSLTLDVLTSIPITIDGTDVSEITIDGDDVLEITIDGDIVF